MAILLREPEADTIIGVVERAERLLIGAPTLLETQIVAAGKSIRLPADLIALIDEIRPEVVAFTSAHVEAATDAFQRFGKGRHPAALNYGDCMAYAVARVADCGLLYKGDDFPRTDVRRAS